MDKVKVRVSMFDEPIEVDPDEVAGLRSQGILVEDPPASEGTGSDSGSDAGPAATAGKRSAKNAAE